MQLCEERLQKKAADIYMETFGEKFHGKVKWSNRLKSSAANANEDGLINLNKLYHTLYGDTETLLALRHELVHVYLFKKIGIHSHDDEEFIYWLNKIGSKQKGLPLPQTVYKYTCPTCKKTLKLSRKISNKLIACANCCDGEFKIKHVLQFSGKETILPEILKH